MDFISELSESTQSAGAEKAVESIREKFKPDKGKDNVEVIAKKVTALLLVQIAEALGVGAEAIRQKLWNHYFPIGYIAGFSVGFIISSGIEDEELKTKIIRVIFDNIFIKDSTDFFNKIFDPQNADNHVFRKGTECGWSEVEASISEEKEPTGLKSFLLEE